MKVSIIEPVGGHGGLDYYDSSLCVSLNQNGVHPILFTSDETEIKDNSLYLTKKYFICFWLFWKWCSYVSRWWRNIK